jgi:hypothetical protein
MYYECITKSSRSRISGYEQSPIRLTRLDTEQQHQTCIQIGDGNVGQENSELHELVAFEVAEDKLETFENRVVTVGRLHRSNAPFCTRDIHFGDKRAPSK